MAIVQGRTRAQLRQSIGYNLGAIRTGTAYDAGSTTTLITLSVLGGDDNWKGYWLVVDDASSTTTETRIVTAYSESTKRLTVQQALSFSTVAGDTFELWDDIYPPEMIERFINQAIIDATGHFYDPVENLSLHTDRSTQRFDIPSGLSMVQDVFYRSKVSSTRLHACAVAFDEHSTLVATTLNGAISDAAATSVTVTSATPLRADQQIMVGSEKMTISSISSNTLTVVRGAGSTTAATHSDGASVLLFPIIDTEDRKQGTGANKFIIPAAAGQNQIVTESISSKNISKYDYVEGWVKSTEDVTAGHLQLLLDDTANCASPLETLSLPALSADKWTFFRVALANPELDTAIISAGLKYSTGGSDIGACTVWLDDISAVKNDTAQWEQIPRNLWSIDKESSDLVLDNYAHGVARYNLLKVVGGDKPALMTADSDTSEVDESYIIAKATALAFASQSGGPATDPDDRDNMAGFWMQQAAIAQRAFPMLTNIRQVA